MIKIALLCLFASCALASFVPYGPIQVVKAPEPENAPIPYDFSFDITDDDGNKQGRQESGDAQGNMKGSYSIQGADGLFRLVEYVANNIGGFTAVIKTNEPGTSDESPAGVTMNKEDAPVVKEVVKEEPVKFKYIRVPFYGGY